MDIMWPSGCLVWIFFMIRVCICYTTMSACHAAMSSPFFLALLYVMCFGHFPIRCPGSGVELDCIDS